MARMPKGQWAARWQRRTASWLQRRIPVTAELTLGHRQLFILPTRQGWVVVLLWLALILTAINYQNAMVFALAFLLSSCLIVAIAHTYRNLAGTTLRLGAPAPVFAGGHARWPIHVSAGSQRARHAIRLAFPCQEPALVELEAGDSRAVKVSDQVEVRGWHMPDRLQIASTWPLGWLRAWSRIQMRAPALVYPAPVYLPLPPPTDDAPQGEAAESGRGDEDLSSLRDYQQGDPLHQVAWKAYARRGELLVKTFSGSFSSQQLWLDLDALAEGSRERRLQVLCGWVLQAEQAGHRYGLRLPDANLAPDHGAAHQSRCLRALALTGGGELT